MIDVTVNSLRKKVKDTTEMNRYMMKKKLDLDFQFLFNHQIGDQVSSKKLSTGRFLPQYVVPRTGQVIPLAFSLWSVLLLRFLYDNETADYMIRDDRGTYL